MCAKGVMRAKIRLHNRHREVLSSQTGVVRLGLWGLSSRPGVGSAGSFLKRYEADKYPQDGQDEEQDNHRDVQADIAQG